MLFLRLTKFVSFRICGACTYIGGTNDVTLEGEGEGEEEGEGEGEVEVEVEGEGEGEGEREREREGM